MIKNATFVLRIFIIIYTHTEERQQRFFTLCLIFLFVPVCEKKVYMKHCQQRNVIRIWCRLKTIVSRRGWGAVRPDFTDRENRPICVDFVCLKVSAAPKTCKKDAEQISFLRRHLAGEAANPLPPPCGSHGPSSSYFLCAFPLSQDF